MNILPKKRWHVRTRDNIARVRRDEAAAAEEEKKKQQRVLLAEKEARTEILRANARARFPAYAEDLIKKDEVVAKKEDSKPLQNDDVSLVGRNGHVNLFYELESTDIVSDGKNAEHEREAKEEREKEEMKIGFLTYLGQDTHELTGEVSWYNRPPKRREPSPVVEKIIPVITTEAPTTSASSYVSVVSSTTSSSLKKSKKHKKKKKKEKKILRLAQKILKKKLKREDKKRRSDSSSSDSDQGEKKRKKRSKRSPEIVEPPRDNRPTAEEIEKMRQERLRRELVERQKAAAHLAKLRGDIPTVPAASEAPPSTVYRKYNSQFHPELARQNKND